MEENLGGSKMYGKLNMGHCMHCPHLSLFFLMEEQEGIEGYKRFHKVFGGAKPVKKLQGLLGAGR